MRCTVVPGAGAKTTTIARPRGLCLPPPTAVLGPGWPVSDACSRKARRIGPQQQIALLAPAVQRSSWSGLRVGVGLPRTHRLRRTIAQAGSVSAEPVTIRLLCKEYRTHPGQQVGVVGSLPEFGQWKSEQALRMKWQPGHAWAVDVTITRPSGGAPIEFKLVLLEGTACSWEPGANRKVVLGPNPPPEVVCTWGLPSAQDTGAAPSAAPVADPAAVMVDCQIVVPVVAGIREGQYVVMTGALSQLGAWKPEQGLKLAQGEDGMWRGRIRLPAGKMVQTKLVVLGGGSPSWEAGDNRVLRLPLPPGHSKSKAAKTAAPEDSKSGKKSKGSKAAVEEPATDTVVPPMHGEYVIMCHHGMPLNYQAVYHTLLPEEARVVGADEEATTLAHFVVPSFPTKPGQSLLLVGSSPELGAWDPAGGVPMTWHNGHAWLGSAELPPDGQQEFEVKVVLNDNGRYVWEPGPNRHVKLAALLASFKAGRAVEGSTPGVSAPPAPPAAVSASSTSAASGPAAVGVSAPAVDGVSGALPGAAEYELTALHGYITCYWGSSDTRAIVVPEYLGVPQPVPLVESVDSIDAEVVQEAVPVVEPRVRERRSKRKPRPARVITVVEVAPSPAPAPPAAAPEPAPVSPPPAEEEGLVRFLSYLLTSQVVAEVWFPGAPGADSSAPGGDRGEGSPVAPGPEGGDPTDPANNIVPGNRRIATTAGAAAVGGAAAALAAVLGSGGTAATGVTAVAAGAGTAATAAGGAALAGAALTTGGVAAAAAGVLVLGSWAVGKAGQGSQKSDATAGTTPAVEGDGSDAAVQQASVTQLSGERDSLLAEVSKVASERDSLLAEVSQAASERNGLRAQVADLQRGLATAEAALTDVRAALSAKEAASQGLEQQLRVESDGLAARLAAAESRLSELRDELSAKQAAAEALENQVAAQSLAADSLAAQLTAAQAQLDASKAGETGRGSSGAAAAAGAMSVLSGLGGGAGGDSELERRIALLTERLSEETAARAALAEATGSGRNALAGLRGQLESLLQRTAWLREQVDARDVALESLRVKYDGLASEHDVVCAKALGTEAKLVAAEATVATLTAEQHALQASLLASEHRATSAEAAHRTVTAELRTVQTQVAQAQARLQGAQDALAAGRAAQAQLAAAAAELNARVAAGAIPAVRASVERALQEDALKAVDARVAAATADRDAASQALRELAASLPGADSAGTASADDDEAARALQARIDALQARASAAEVVLHAAVCDRAALLDALAAAAARVQAAAADAAESAAAEERAASAAVALQGRLSQLEDEVQARMLDPEQTAVIRSLAAELQASQERGQARITELEGHLTELRSELQAAHAAQLTAQAEAGAARAAADSAVKAQQASELARVDAMKQVAELLAQVQSLQAQIKEVKLLEEDRSRSEAQRLTRAFEARLDAQKRLLLAAREQDVAAAVTRAKQEVEAILKVREAQVSSLQAAVESLEDQLDTIKDSMSAGLGLVLPPLPARRPPGPALPAAAAPSPSPATSQSASPPPAEKKQGGGFGFGMLRGLFGGGGKKSAEPSAAAPSPSPEPAAVAAVEQASAVAGASSNGHTNGAGVGPAAPADIEVTAQIPSLGSNGSNGNGNGNGAHAGLNGNGNGLGLVASIDSPSPAREVLLAGTDSGAATNPAGQ